MLRTVCRFSLKLNCELTNLTSEQKRKRGSTRHFDSKCYHDSNPFQQFKVQLSEQVLCNYLENIEDILWGKEKYWQPELFTISKGMNNILDLYSSKRKGCRKG